jgi:predicted Zn-dependent protease
MRFRSLFTGSVIVLAVLAAPASAQTSQVGKTWQVGDRAGELEWLAQQIEDQDWRVSDQGYIQQIENRVASAAGVKPEEVRMTNRAESYGFLIPGGILYLSSGLLKRMSNEAELAGLLAHETAHGRQHQCALAKGYLPLPLLGSRDAERQATETAIRYMKAAGYDPLALLDVVTLDSKLASSAHDLARLRRSAEAQSAPVAIQAIDDRAFTRFHQGLVEEWNLWKP